MEKPLAPARTLTPGPSPKGRGEHTGYSLVVLIVAVAVLNILIAAMLPLWSTAIRREKEEELIFRGFQYAEAIRVFHIRYQRYPNKLEELLEVKPRCIRQLWKDPMTDDGKWGLIFQNQPQSVRVPRGGKNPPQDKEEQAAGQRDDQDGRPQFGPRKGETVQIGPIIGVQSKSDKKSILIFFNHERYDEWQFTEPILLSGMSGGQRASIQGNPAVGNPGQNMMMGQNFSTRWLGRPMRFFNQPPGGTLPQDGTMPDGSRPGKPKPKPKPQ
jgi:type II secretory pathway pseudopilin PulG